MKQQVLVVHGGDAFDSYENYIADLKSKEVTIEKLKSIDWKGNLQKNLGSKFDVLTPRFPNSQNARYSEWKIWFEKIIPLLDDDVILIGHSLGGIFLAKYLSENKILKMIKALFLVAAPFNTPQRHPLADFNITTSLKGVVDQVGKIYIYHSRDDQVVPFSNLGDYQMEIPRAEIRVFRNRGHFNAEDFPELIKDLKDLD